MPDNTLLQPFRRNLAFDPVIIPIGSTVGVPTPVPPMTGGGVTAFKMFNPNPFWVWYRGWGTAENPKAEGDMPVIKEKGHYIGPGMVDICRTQMPQWIGAVGNEEPDFPLYPAGASSVTTGAGGRIMWGALSCRLVMIYGSGS